MRSKQKILSLAWVLAALMAFSHQALPGEKQEAPKPGDIPAQILATVNGVPIPLDDLLVSMAVEQKRYANRGMRVAEADLPMFKRMVLERLITDELFFQESKKEGVKVDEKGFADRLNEVKSRFPSEQEFQRSLAKEMVTEESLLAQATKQASIKELLSIKFMDKARPSEKEITAFYKENPDKFVRPDEVRASHILVGLEKNADKKARKAALKRIRAVAEEVRKGKDFGDMARKYSDCPTKQKEGDLGFFTRGKTVKPFEDAAFALESGQVSDVVETEFGYHIIKMMEKRPGSKILFEEAEPGIKNYLASVELEKMTAEYAKALREKAKVVILDPEIAALPLPMAQPEDNKEKKKK